MQLQTFFSHAKSLFVISLGCAFLSNTSHASTEQTLSIYGSNTIGEQLGPELASSFLKSQGFQYVNVQQQPETQQHIITAGNDPKQTQVRINIHSQGSSTGFTALHNGTGKIAAASRPIKEQEASLLTKLGDMRSKNAEHVLAIDGLAVIVHSSNPIQTLSTEQLSAIFSGELNDWSELGANPAPIRVYARDNHSGTWETFKELVLSPNGKTLTADAQRFESNANMAFAINRDPKAIGFVSLPYVRQNKAIAISEGDAAAMQPSTALIATEDYPLSRRLYLYSAEHEKDSLARAFLAFSQSAEGQHIVEKNGFTSQAITAISATAPENSPAYYQELTKNAQRLTVNFRFNKGSAQLDTKAQRDIERVLTYLHQHGKTKRKLVLVGFDDNAQDPQRAVLLSKLRAMAVRRALQDKELITRDVTGIGNAVPVASSHLDQGHNRNRRVELWVY